MSELIYENNLYAPCIKLSTFVDTIKMDIMETILIEVTNRKAMRLLRELEDLHLIKVLKKDSGPVRHNLSDKYKGIINKKQAADLNNHIDQMRNEWGNI